jgi:DNA-binding NarL/FixJ family response regulator
MTPKIELSSRELTVVLGLLSSLHEAADVPDLGRMLVRDVRRVIEVDQATFHDAQATSTISTRALTHADAQPPTDPRRAHRLGIAVVASPSHSVGVALTRWSHAFTAKDVAKASLMQAHLPAVYDHVRLRQGHHADANLELLTEREREVLALVADGCTDRAIARMLFIEPRTVEKHVEHVRAKLGARTRAEAAARYASAAPAASEADGSRRRA